MVSNEAHIGGWWKSLKDIFKANPSFVFCLILFVGVVVTIFMLAAIFPDYEIKTGLLDLPPSADHLLGTTHLGYDNLISLINGAKNSLIIGFGAAGISVPIAIIMGTVSGYRGGQLDNALSTITNVILVLPTTSLFMIIAASVGAQSLEIVIVLIGALIWPWAARSIRSQVMTLKEREFVNLARITPSRASLKYKIFVIIIGILFGILIWNFFLGLIGELYGILLGILIGSLFVLSLWTLQGRIAITEILPNMLSYIVLVFAMEIVIGVGIEASLSIIGVSQPGRITLGRMLFEALNWSQGLVKGYYWLWVPPGLILLLIVMVIYILQASMPQMFNPRLRER